MIGNWLCEKRKEHGFSVIEVASIMETTKEKYQNIENGTISVTIHFFAKFLLLFEIEHIDFFGVELLLHSKEPVSSFNKLGNQIRESRIESGYSLRSLAAIVGISHTALRNLEKGAKRVMLLRLIRLDDALGKEGR